MTVAMLRLDGWPQATTVGYVDEGLPLYFLCGLDSQKATNLARDDGDYWPVHGSTCTTSERSARGGQSLAHAAAEVPGTDLPADPSADEG